MEIVEREACYLIDTIEHAMERIIGYNDLTEEELKLQKEFLKKELKKNYY